MDLITASFLALAGLGACAALLHMVGWVPPRYKRVLRALQSQFASQVGLEVEGALERVAVRQEAKYADGLKAAESAAVQGEKDAMKSAIGAMARAGGIEKQYHRQVDAALAEAILGPAKPILAQFAPSLLDALEANPQLLPMIIEHPLFQKYVAPRIQQFLGQQQGASPSGKNPFLTE